MHDSRYIDDTSFPASYHSGSKPPFPDRWPNAVAFISSQLVEMQMERETAMSVCREIGITTIAWEEKLGLAQPRAPRDAFLDGVRQSDVFIMLLGSVLSNAVLAEFDEARRNNLDALLFVKSLDANNDRDPQLEAFLEAVREEGGVVYSPYNNIDDLRQKLLDSLEILVEKKGKLWVKLSGLVLSPEDVQDEGSRLSIHGFTHDAAVESSLRSLHDSGRSIPITVLCSGETRMGRLRELRLQRSSAFRCNYILGISVEPRIPRTEFDSDKFDFAVREISPATFDLVLGQDGPTLARGLESFQQSILLSLHTCKGELFFNRAFGSNLRELFAQNELDNWRLELLARLDIIETLTMPLRQSGGTRISPAMSELERIRDLRITDIDREHACFTVAMELEVRGISEPVRFTLQLRGLR